MVAAAVAEAVADDGTAQRRAASAVLLLLSTTHSFLGVKTEFYAFRWCRLVHPFTKSGQPRAFAGVFFRTLTWLRRLYRRST